VMKMKEGRTPISVKVSTYDKLNSLRKLDNKTFDKVITDLISKWFE